MDAGIPIDCGNGIYTNYIVKFENSCWISSKLGYILVNPRY